MPPWGLALFSMTAVQLGSALSVHVIAHVGAGGMAWLRLTIGAVIFIAIARPPLREVRRGDWPLLLALGVTVGLQTVAFLASIARIPLGTSVAIEFLGPMTVAAARAHSRRALVWPLLALLGVVLMTQPWHGHVNFWGVAFALLSGVGWGIYILLTQAIGDRFTGIGALSLTVPVAALTAAAFGIPQASGHLTLGLIAQAVGLAILMPVLPYALELLALRKMTQHAFGTLMALEPAIAIVLGLVVLGQSPAIIELIGIMLVVLAGAASQRGGARQPVAV